MHKAELRKLLCSMLLGDGSVTGSKTGLWFQLHHSTKQRDYLEWKIREIDYILKKKSVMRSSEYKDKSYFNDKTQKTYYSCSYRLYWPKYFRIFRQWVYRQDKTKRAEFLLRHMETDKQLFIWFMDDGSEESHLNKHVDGSTYRTKPRLMLHICDYSLEDAKMMQKWFEQKYDVKPRLVFTTKQQPRLRFVAKDAEIIFSRISVYVKQITSARFKFKQCLERY